MLRHLRIFIFNDLKEEVEWKTMLAHLIITSNHIIFFAIAGDNNK